jgi:hypothetical protein
MRFIVVLDQRHVIGRIHSGGNNEGVVPDGELKHPVLDCLSVSTDSPYLLVKRDMRKVNREPQTIYIPHAAVIGIYPYGPDDDAPFGFVEHLR